MNIVSPFFPFLDGEVDPNAFLTWITMLSSSMSIAPNCMSSPILIPRQAPMFASGYFSSHSLIWLLVGFSEQYLCQLLIAGAFLFGFTGIGDRPTFNNLTASS